jgi:Flp pilus assembly protein TadG
MRLSPRNDRGTVAIEFVLIVPFFLILMFGVLAIGGFISVKTRTVGAARDGARAAALSQAFPTEPSGITLTRTSAACPPRTDPNFSTTNVTVQAQSTYSQFGILGIPSKTITESVTMRCGG